MNYSEKFDMVKAELAKIISLSKSVEDPNHAENTLFWMLQLKPDADEILQIAAFGHDTERALPDRVRRESYDNYDDYKRSHARRSGDLVADIALAAGYGADETKRLANIIAEGEFQSEDPEVQLMCDADSISFFDNNLAYYIQDKGVIWAKPKMSFAYERSSARAKQHIRDVLARKPELNLIDL